MMKLEIKLKDPKYCDGCPCIAEVSIEHVDPDLKWYCAFYDKDLTDPIMGMVDRPKKCIKENGA